MAKTNTFIAGVGTAEIFSGDVLFASARTLIDSSITIGVSVEDLRAGQGNALWGRYFHSSTFDLKLTDAMFNLEYLAANVGSEIEMGGDVFKDEELIADADGKVTLALTAVPIRTGSTVVYAYIREALNGGAKRSAVLVKEEEVTVGEGADAQTKTVSVVSGLTPDVKYCVRYMYNDGNSRKMTVNSNFIPGTFSVILTTPLFSGDACNAASTATKVGQLTIKVPRFQLNGSQELSMSASGISNTSFEGSALASGCTGCDDNGIYAEIIETIFNALWYDNYVGLEIEESEVESTVADYKPEPVVVYAIPASGSPLKIDNDIIALKEEAVDAKDKTKLVYSIEAGTTGLSIDENGVISGTPAAGTATVTVVLMNTTTNLPIPGFSATKTIELTA